MNNFSKILSFTVTASLTIACAGRAPAPVSASSIAARSCAGQKVSSDAQVRALASCTSFRGDLTISGSVTTLAPLASVQSVHGTLAIEATAQLESLEGLEQLRSVARLSLNDNAELDDIAALAALDEVAGISVTHNPELESLRGLEGVRSLQTLAIVGNGLYTLRGLGNLRALGELVVAKNRRLIELRALSGVSAAERITVVDNRRLSGYGGLLKNLQRLPTFVTVSGNPVTVAEIEHLTSTKPTRSDAGFARIDTNRMASAK